jgi:hypothetical protein
VKGIFIQDSIGRGFGVKAKFGKGFVERGQVGS